MASQQDEARSDERKRAILDRQLNGIQSQEKQSINVFAYATLADKIIMSVSSACAIFAGALNPLVPVIYGLLVSVFNGFTAGTVTEGELRSKLSTFNLYYVYLSIGLFVFHYVATFGFYYSGDHMARALRTAYLSAIMRQNMAFFDLLEPGEITNRIMSDMGTVQEAVTSKISVLLSAIATFCAAFAVAFIMYWKAALIMSPFFVAMVASASIGGAYSVKYHKRAMKLYSQASGVAEEAISAIRYVTAFGIQGLLSQRYLSVLEQAAEVNSKAENIVAALIAWMNAMPCLLYALSFWAGSKFLVKGEVSVAEITATLAVTIGSFAIIRIAPSAQALTSGVAIAGEVLKAIARRSPQDPLAEDGQQPPGMVGNVQLDQVGLVYPSRGDVKVLKNVTLTCAAMKKTAIVGPSGSGKSSILGLVERFYEPTSGTVMLDGRDVQTLNLRWLRRQLALVDQNPVLFNASIFENIQYGCSDILDRLSEAEKYQKVTEASKKANAHDFIMALPDGYQTQVGEKGLQLSGGQRQRIAIARALIKDPKILLLDEATSALDSKSEATVQAALDGASEHRTTIIIAHRLSTIRNADKIIVLAEGMVVEEGSHNELIARNGVYASLVQKQQIEDTKKGTATDATRLSVDGVHSTTSKCTVNHLNEKDIHRVQTNELAYPSTNRAETTTGKYVHQPSAKQTLSFIGRMSRTDWKLLLFVQCSQAVFFAELLTVIGYPPSQYGQLKHQVTVWSGVYVALAGAAFISWMGVEVALSYATQNLSHRARDVCFRSIMVQVMSFFDEPGNRPSALSSVLSKSTDDLAGMGGPVIGGILTFIATILGGIVLSLAVGWKLAPVCTATIPVVVVCGWLRLQVLAAFDTKIRQSGLDSAAYAGELVRSVRTVASLGLEEYALARYDGFVTKQAAKSLRSILVASALYSASQSIVYLCAALGFWYGGTLIANREYPEFQVYICFVSLISGAQIAGSIFTYAPDASKAMHASQELQMIIDLKPTINNASQGLITSTGYNDVKGGHHQDINACRIEFENVVFSYPSRPTRRALDNLSITVEPGQTLALVGQSGSGKSTCVSLLERFYEPDQGRILIDGQDIRQRDVDEHRRTISLVSQETVMFSGTIRENIAIGLAGEEVSNDNILAACKQANILESVGSLPDGLSTLVGTGGSMLGGGQKQRIAIARAFLRRPKILLLDEATSALDTESEAIVQAAMDAIRKDRTTIMVAHRLSTIRNADVICVLQDGALVEIGSHEQLMERRGRYWEIVGMQNLH
ncbi:P-loop containing nucleoside triphosphate hydrolase protein [Aspergillus alliaceus]|uniref:P-loop containing nucleoside triphosphate hydrolase protein n=1 Tax=Petromyces alliaceus TaxID=209559 RepID=A0A5N7CF62_PETAA|nr:P-loop containing nucleoside triphosphate hydrolase protein [Aspergillus alliaceus]